MPFGRSFVLKLVFGREFFVLYGKLAVRGSGQGHQKLGNSISFPRNQHSCLDSFTTLFLTNFYRLQPWPQSSLLNIWPLPYSHFSKTAFWFVFHKHFSITWLDLSICLEIFENLKAGNLVRQSLRRFRFRSRLSQIKCLLYSVSKGVWYGKSWYRTCVFISAFKVDDKIWIFINFENFDLI